MNRTVIILTILLAGSAATALAVWESVGPEGGPVDCIMQSNVNSNLFYASSGSYPVKIIRSSDEGSTWEQSGSCNYYFYSMGLGPTDILYGGSYGRIYVSEDEGQTWDSYSISGFLFWDITGHPSDESILYGAGYHYSGGGYRIAFARSTDGGSNWSVTDLSTSCQGYGRCVAVSASDPDIIYVSGYRRDPYQPKLYKSTDGGDSFTEITYSGWSSDYYMYTVAVHPANPDIVLAGCYYNIYRSTDGGSSWTDVTSSMYYHYGLAFSEDDPNVAFSGGSSAIHRSLNEGVSWTRQTNGLPSGVYGTLALDWGNSAHVLTGCDNGIYRSTDTGDTWEESSDGMVIANVLAFNDVLVGDDYTLYLSAEDLGMYKTTDYGANWEILGTPLGCGDVCAMASPTATPNTVLAFEGTG
ncbi:hypothetical protein GF402_11240 [Candidatus Fermentibacteria bacterium]|nr:hypothetical protein [Candidatus Fermentibacteria bacterium]